MDTLALDIHIAEVKIPKFVGTETREDPEPGDIYLHFKGNLYFINDIAEDCNNDSRNHGRKGVVYTALYSPWKKYFRYLDEFMSPVDRDKYPNLNPNLAFRFTKVLEIRKDDSGWEVLE